MEKPVLKITYEVEGRPTVVVTTTPECLIAADAKAKELGFKEAVHFVNEFLMGNLLVGVVLPSARHSEEDRAELARLSAEVAAKTAEFEAKRLAAFLPTMTIDGVEVTLPQIRAQVAAEKAAAAEAAKEQP